MNALSEKQLEYLSLATQGIHLGCGAVRSGKTYVQIMAFLGFLITKAEPGVNCLITAKKLDVIQRNILDDMQKAVKANGYDSVFQFKRQPYMVVYKPKDIKCYCEGANDANAEGNIRGMTIQAWVGDEVTLYPKDVFLQCLTRLSTGKRLGLLTCNPDRMTHYVYQEFIRTNRISIYNFSFADNPSLDPSYVDMLKTLHTGVFYTRYIEGQWGGDEDSLVVPEFYQLKEKIVCVHETPKEFIPIMALDVGWRDFTFAVFGYYDFEKALIIIEDEVVIKKKMNTEMLAEMVEIKEEELWGRPSEYRFTDVDLRLVEDMRVLHGLSFIPTRKDDKEAQINTLRILFKKGKIFIHPRCVNLIEHLEAATWDKKRKSYERTESHGHFDGVDALIYMIRNTVKNNPYGDPAQKWREEGQFVSPKYQYQGESSWQKLKSKRIHFTESRG